MMQLTAELYKQIVAGLRSDEHNSTKRGKRKEGRVGVRFWADLVPPVGNEIGTKAARVVVRDLSPSGMGFTSRDKMNVGLEMVLRLPDDTDSIIEVPMRIKHCTQVAKDLYVVGARFNSPPPPAGADPERSDELDRRKMDLSQLLYISDAKAPMSKLDLDLLIATARRKNSASNLTGLLLYSAGHFIQLLEGDRPAVANLLCIVSHDARHQNVRQLYLGPCDKRLFPSWEMGLLNLDGFKELDQARLLEGVDLLKKTPDAATILSVFRGFSSQLRAKSDPIDQAA